MQNLPIREVHYKINNIEYHLKLIPTKHYDSSKKRPSIDKKSFMDFGPTHNLTKTEGRVECEKKMWGPIPFKSLKKWKKIGKFSESWHDYREASSHYLDITLKECPKIIIRIDSFHSDFGGTESNRVLIKKRGTKNRYSPLEIIIQ